MIATLVKLAGFFAEHPLTRDKPSAAWLRFASHQLRVRAKREVIFPWIGNAKLAIGPAMTGATGNVYAGLHEFPEMGFLLHYLRPEDVFFDVGANVGSYTVLASAVAGARSVAFEPDPITAKRLRRNIQLNDIGSLVEVQEVAVGRVNGPAAFTTGLDTMNSLQPSNANPGQVVDCVRLDDVKAPQPSMMKVGVEGYEEGVLDGGVELIKNERLEALMIENLTDQMYSMLIGFGFQRMYYEPRTRELSSRPLGLKESNALFVKNPTTCLDRVKSAKAFTVLYYDI